MGTERNRVTGRMGLEDSHRQDLEHTGDVAALRRVRSGSTEPRG